MLRAHSAPIEARIDESGQSSNIFHQREIAVFLKNPAGPTGPTAIVHLGMPCPRVAYFARWLIS